MPDETLSVAARQANESYHAGYERRLATEIAELIRPDARRLSGPPGEPEGRPRSTRPAGAEKALGKHILPVTQTVAGEVFDSWGP